jgi:DNA-binding MarR family transcriptional regulator
LQRDHTVPEDSGQTAGVVATSASSLQQAHPGGDTRIVENDLKSLVLGAEEVFEGPIPLVEQSPCAAIRAANRAVSQFYDLVLAPTGLKATQFIALQAIYEKREIAQCEFARHHAVAVETLSRRFGGLRSKGYIQVRTGHRHSERVYSLTDKGLQALRDATPYWERAQERLRKVLGENDWRIVPQMLDRLRAAALHAEELRTENHLH